MKSLGPDASQITVLDLFAGCGGLTEGFHQFRSKDAGDEVLFRSVGAVEWDPSAAASYEMNLRKRWSRKYPPGALPPVMHRDDITVWSPPSDLEAVDVVVGGPPCQGFSGLNRHKVKPERNKLWEHFIRVVEQVQPKVFVIENVDRFVRSPEFQDLQERMRDGRLENYALVDPPGAKPDDEIPVQARRYLLNAADYGAPQARRRAIVIGVRTDAGLNTTRFRYPKPTRGRHVSTGAVQEGFEGLHDLQPWVAADEVFAVSARMPLSEVDLPHRGPVYDGVVGTYLTTDLHITRNPEQVSLARYRAIPAEGNRADLERKYLCIPDDGSHEFLIRKEGRPRDPDGALAVEGDYVVLDGKFKHKRGFLKLTGRAVPRPPAPPGRHKPEWFSVQVDCDGSVFDARVVYLSTPSWDRHHAGSGDVMGRARSGYPSVTIRTEFFKPEKGRYLHPTEDRPITHFEAAKLQGFPDDFLWCGPKTEIAKQIGNAVPIPLGRSIAGSIHEYLRGR